MLSPVSVVDAFESNSCGRHDWSARRKLHQNTRPVRWQPCARPHRDESTSHWQQQDYKAFSPAVDSYDKVDWSSAPAIQVSHLSLVDYIW